MKLSDGEILKIRRLRKGNFDWRTIAANVGCTVEAAEQSMRDKRPHRKAPQRSPEALARLRDSRRAPAYGLTHVPHSVAPAASAVADAEARRAAPRSITGEIMGDPPAGYSALDRRSK